MSEHAPSKHQSDKSNQEQSPWMADLDEERLKIHPRDRDTILLGGGDAEMKFIERAAKKMGVVALNNVESWERADVHQYDDEIESIIESGKTPVAIELRGAGDKAEVVEVDHHNDKSDRPSSLLQVLERFGLQPSLAEKFVAANDSAYIPGMEQVLADHLDSLRKKGFGEQALEASKNRLVRMMAIVRRIDRREQGVTQEMEDEAEEAIAHMQVEPNGMRIVRLNGDRPSPVTDRMFGTWDDGHQNIVVVCNSDKGEQEVWFFGDGATAKTAKEHFLAKKEARIKSGDTSTSNEHHSWGGGIGFGEQGKDAFCGIVTTNPQEAIDYLQSLQTEQK